MSAILVDNPAPQVKRVTFNRPEALNAFHAGMYLDLLDILRDTGRDPHTRVLVITGAGKGFCAGHDNVNPDNSRTWVAEGVGKLHSSLHFMNELNRITSVLRNLPQPVIAAVNGSAAGLGYSMALACDMAIAAQSAKFVNAFHNAGTGSEIGLSYLLPRVVGAQRAAELLLTARPVLADEAERIGLVLQTVPDDKLMETVLDIANNIIVNAPLDVWLTKQNMYQNMHAGSVEQAVIFETRAIAMVNATEDAQEKRNARKEKRAPKFRNA
ncbi:MAG TPA: enoyl-CoA hydratase-related protein [Burkholderiales bacterium]|nr:enoyl-CoA hydratase-related protein [Burkholderiales bacterium]